MDGKYTRLLGHLLLFGGLGLIGISFFRGDLERAFASVGDVGLWKAPIGLWTLDFLAREVAEIFSRFARETALGLFGAAAAFLGYSLKDSKSSSDPSKLGGEKP
jgi:hypothetical protein